MNAFNEDAMKKDRHNPLWMFGSMFAAYCGMCVMVYEKGLPGLSGGGEWLSWGRFVTLLPLVVLFFFIIVVCRHHEKLYAPSDFRNEENFVRLCKKERNQESDL